MENKIYKNVVLGDNVTIGDFVDIGVPPKGKQDGELKTVIGSNAVIRSHTVIYAGNTIGDNFQTGHQALIREQNQIGSGVSIGSSSVVEFSTKIGDNVRIHSQAFIPEYCVLEDDTWVGPNVVLTNATYPKSKGVKEQLSGVILRKNSKIGANATLLPGVEIGTNALVGAGSVVTKSVASGKVVAGNPAVEINSLDKLPY